MSTSPSSVLLAEVVRSDWVEGRHRGSAVVLGADGSVEREWGDPGAPVFPRSANKPFQAAGVLSAGLRLGGRRLALGAASHSGEPFHLELVERMLAEYGLAEEQLGCPPDLPLDAEEAERFLAAGRTRSRIAMNCSGKHTAMLAVCAERGWPTEGYLAPDHPLQRGIRATLESAAQEPVAHTGVDGCGAPLLAVSLTGLARAFRTLATADAGTPEGRVADAMRAHPEYVAGTRRHDTWLMRELPGAVSKMGAEGVQGFALPDGRALAFKVDDGAARALGPVLVSLLRGVGVSGEVLERVERQPVFGGGGTVGEVRAVV
ncbi:asparaginase [Streptomyces xiaopingdaonensis]|uniref:asparaginase n=1 Tax=Streptomyces xiaopingdaonensis TaxID=1565415 RepID=UPI00031D37A5|nr:asparaginase [Streptomyces xiaopingdaonensis]